MNPAPVHPPCWRAAAPPSLTALQKHWLLRPGALTAGLRQLGAVHLQVLREAMGGAPPDEALALRVAVGTPVWVREVLMRVDGVVVVAARSLAPLAATHGVWQGMRGLRARPLADMLYHNRRIARSRFAVARVQRPLAFAAALRRVNPVWTREQAIFARRSVFYLGGQPLLVAEGFLPAFWQIADDADYV